MTIEVEAGGETAHRGGFATAGFAGDEAQTAFSEQKIETGAEFALTLGWEELSRGMSLVKGRRVKPKCCWNMSVILFLERLCCE